MAEYTNLQLAKDPASLESGYGSLEKCISCKRKIALNLFSGRPSIRVQISAWMSMLPPYFCPIFLSIPMKLHLELSNWYMGDRMNSIHVVNANVRVMSVLHMKQIATLFSMIWTTKEYIDLLK
jgi:hypothetical protein